MNQIALGIYNIIKPYLGMVAQPMVENSCKRMGMNPNEITKEELEKVLPKIEREVIFFSDEEVGGEVNRKLREFLRGL
jgi:hypothetical protein